MQESISYLEISCTYNRIDLINFAGGTYGENVRRVVVYRNRRYYLSYDNNTKEFTIFNSRDIIIAILRYDIFKFYPSKAPEIGLNLVWGLLAKLNVYPVKSF